MRYGIIRLLIFISIISADIALNADELPCFPYPVKKLDLLFNALGKDTVTIFAYGSLLDAESAGHTISKKTIDSYQPAIALGYSRTFDRHVEATPSSNNTGMLNLFKSEGIVNGVAFQVKKKELEALLAREIGYDLVPITIRAWEENNPEPFIAYTFIASEFPRDGKHYTKSTVEPDPDYAKLCQTAAARFGKKFEQLWVETSYLSDRKTPYATWLNQSAACLRIAEKRRTSQSY